MKLPHAALQIESLERRQLLSAYLPSQIRQAYGFNQLAWDGHGQTIAIVAAYDDPTIEQDLTTFDRYFGFQDPPSFTKVDQWGGVNYPETNGHWACEIALDVEWTHALATGANLLLVEARSAFLYDVCAAVDYARNQPGVVVVSMSFGACEQANEVLDDGFFTTPADHVGGSGLAGGVTFVAATGDSGAPGIYPAYSPNVLAVGGTSLFLDYWGNVADEWAWGGSGGGLSQYEPEPAYQNGVQNTGVRSIPDVAYDADPSTGFWVFNTTGAGGWSSVGGTSAGTPQWAALVALVDQMRAEKVGLGSLDGASQTLPALYDPACSSDFRDITLGSNGYDAGQGYDLVTGLGTPWAPALVTDLALVGIALPGGGAQAVPVTPSAPSSSELLPGARSANQGRDALFVELTRPAAVANFVPHLSLPTILGERSLAATPPASQALRPLRRADPLPSYTLGESRTAFPSMKWEIVSADEEGTPR